jgi:hypothetical protein
VGKAQIALMLWPLVKNILHPSVEKIKVFLGKTSKVNLIDNSTEQPMQLGTPGLKGSSLRR